MIVRPGGSVVLIDFDIARVYRRERETDMRPFDQIGDAATIGLVRQALLELYGLDC